MRRVLNIAVGTVFVLIGIVGIFVPLLPTTVFFIVAAYFYARSSERLYRFVLNFPKFGRYVRMWEEYRAVPYKVKVLASVMTVVSTSLVALASFNSGNLLRGGIFLLVGAALLVLIVRLKTLPEGVSVEEE